MRNSTTLHLLSGGAAQGLVAQLQAGFEAQHLCQISGQFGAVGVMLDRMLAGEACDVIVLTQPLIQQLADLRDVMLDSAQPLGVVKTGVAVKSGEAAPKVGTAKSLKSALLAATGIYFPDPVKATAGIHFMKVLQALGIDRALSDRLRPFANGATAMRAMAACPEAGLIGCTQVTEILYTQGVQLAAPLPKKFELATVYTAAVNARAAHPELAASLIGMLCAADAAQIRRNAGFA